MIFRFFLFFARLFNTSVRARVSVMKKPNFSSSLLLLSLGCFLTNHSVGYNSKLLLIACTALLFLWLASGFIVKLCVLFFYWLCCVTVLVMRFRHSTHHTSSSSPRVARPKRERTWLCVPYNHSTQWNHHGRRRAHTFLSVRFWPRHAQNCLMIIWIFRL